MKEEFQNKCTNITVYHRTTEQYLTALSNTIKPQIQEKTILNTYIDRTAGKPVIWLSLGAPNRLGEIMSGHWFKAAKDRDVAIQFSVPPEKLIFPCGFKAIFGGYQVQLCECYPLSSSVIFERKTTLKGLSSEWSIRKSI